MQRINFQRINFYKLNLKKSFEDFRKSLIIAPSKAENGFITVIESKDEYLYANFHIKLLIEERIQNPFGEYEKINYYIYQKIGFFIFNRNNEVSLGLLNQPKSIKYFTNFLKKCDSLFFSITNYNINLKQNLLNRNIKIIKAKFADVELSTNSYACIEITSKNDAISDFNLLTTNGFKKLTRVKIIEDFENIYFENEFNEKATFSLKIDNINYHIVNYIYEKYIAHK